MKKIIPLFLVLFISSHFAHSQTYTLAQLKAMKDVFQPDIVQIKDSEIAYPVTGMVNIDVKSSLMGETVVEVEVWVVDSKGKLVYNTVFAAKDLSEKNFDREYMRYMSLQGRKLLKRRQVWAGNGNRKTGDS